jgi:hypothetical protein
VDRDNRLVRYIVLYLPAFVYLRADENNVGKLPCNLVVGEGLTPNRWWVSSAHARAFSDRVMNVRSD